MREITASIILALGAAAAAEPTFVTVPGQGWHLVVDVPPISHYEGKSSGERFRYMGSDVESGITFSVHTEVIQDGRNADCRDKYWEKAKKNSYIVQDSAEMFETDRLLGVSYRSEGEYQGQPFTTVNAHGYFVINGKCVDLHVSQIPFSEEGKKTVEQIVRTSRIVQ